MAPTLFGFMDKVLVIRLNGNELIDNIAHALSGGKFADHNSEKY